MEENRLTEKTAIVTGANSGLGLETAKVFAAQGVQITLAVRDMDKGQTALEDIKKEAPGASIEVMKLDLSDLGSVRDFAEQVKGKMGSLDLLINNAGVMVPPFTKTKDGIELQFASNHLGHFALTGRLLPLLLKAPASRIVTLSSLAHRGAAIDFDNLDGSKGYKGMKFYGQSKLANLMFAQELDKRLKQHGLSTISIACHPGISATNLFKFGKREAPRIFKGLMNRYFQPAAMGALPTIYAATEPGLKGGEYIGPDGKGQRRGYPAIETPHPAAHNEEVSKRLWEVSEKLTGVSFDFTS
ncbi:SDR family oxidoreductase [Planomicrobium chinense]|uniref:oxidoreductase n=1 Tax=Planococcus chinensis TaxID=272917 RepID=UPI001CC40F00|nr:oxidoreductase [Planococcus chinensis]MBZ5201694.1 SDR family oxidoreductase [Planococcus chinensis]MCP2035604.1 NAD(P)-dependent dehydrogenase (short-subunit alcohol dehydrogenase family) [Planomicrobium sp. HSC-17F08]